MKGRVVKATVDHKAFRDDCIIMLKKHAGHLDAIDMLALSAHLVGQVLAMQDQRTVDRERALETVMRNIEAGNAEVLENLNKPQGRA